MILLNRLYIPSLYQCLPEESVAEKEVCGLSICGVTDGEEMQAAE